MGSGDGAPPCRAPEAGALASPSTASAASCAYPPQRPPSDYLLTELVTRASGPSPLASVAEQRYGQARFVATPRRVYCLPFERSGLRKHADVGLELLGQRRLQFPFNVGW